MTRYFSFSLSGLNTVVENRTLWSTFTLVNDFEATEVEELDELRKTLNDLFKDIKCYVPSDMDRAADIAINLRPAILATCEDYDKFLNSDVKTIGMATSLLQIIEGHRSTVFEAWTRHRSHQCLTSNTCLYWTVNYGRW